MRERWKTELPDHVLNVGYQSNGTLLAAVSASGPIHVLRSRDGTAECTFEGCSSGTTGIAWSPESDLLASIGKDAVLRVWNVASKKLAWSGEATAPWAERVAWSGDGQILAVAAGKFVRLWDRQGNELKIFGPHSSTVLDIAWKPESHQIAATSYGCVTLWNADLPEPTRTYRWRGSSLVLAWSPDGRFLATGDQDATVHFWVTETGHDYQMSGFPRKVKELSWDSSSRWLANGGGSQACIWDCSPPGPSDREPMILEAHERSLTTLAFQHRRKLLATGGEEGRVMIWRPLRGNSAVSASLEGPAITQVIWSPDDTAVLAGDESGGVRLFQVIE